MTREDWQIVEDKLFRYPLASISLLVDGRTVRLHNVRDKQRIVIAVYIDGWIKGEWLNPDKECPERAYMRAQPKYVFGKKYRDNLEKLEKKLGKKRAKELGVASDRNAKRISYWPWFPSVRALKSQYEKTFKSIELVTE